MSSRFSVDIDRLEQAATQLGSLAGFVADQLDAFDDKVAALRTDGWDGLAASAFDDAQRQWVSAARSFVDEIRDLGEHAQRARDRYAAAAELNRRMVRGG